MDYPCDKFRDFSFSRFGFIVRTDRQTYILTDAAKRFTLATGVGGGNSDDLQTCVVVELCQSERKYS